MTESPNSSLHDRGREPWQPSAAQRWGAAAAAGALAIYGITRRSKLGALVAASGGALAYFAMKADTAPRQAVARSSVLLNCPPEQAYRFWQDFENFPRFMRHLESVSVIGDRRTRWVAHGPLGRTITWDAELVHQRPNESISWRSLPGSELTVDGWVEFREAPAGRGTVVTATMLYQPPAGKVGAGIAKLLGKDPDFLMRQDMRRMKALIETGELPTVEGQPHGPRSVVAGVARVLDPDRPHGRGAKLSEIIAAERRIS